MRTDLVPTRGLPISALTDGHAPFLSDRYVPVSTPRVIDMMTDAGYVIAETKADRPSRRDPRYVRHQIDFRFGDVRPGPDGVLPRVLFTNSHNGRTRASFQLGVFRQICSNGMVVGSVWAQERVRHSGDLARELIERIRGLAANTAPLFAQIERWTAVELTASQTQDFARRAAELRFGDAGRFTPEALLNTRRPEDEGRSLWRVFNRIQENAVRGGLVGASAAGRALRSRELAGITSLTNFNSDLWALADEFAPA
jgi:hypothetical protein